jgi:hypothetical protein
MHAQGAEHGLGILRRLHRPGLAGQWYLCARLERAISRRQPFTEVFSVTRNTAGEQQQGIWADTRT